MEMTQVVNREMTWRRDTSLEMTRGGDRRRLGEVRQHMEVTWRGDSLVPSEPHLPGHVHLA